MDEATYRKKYWDRNYVDFSLGAPTHLMGLVADEAGLPDEAWVKLDGDYSVTELKDLIEVLAAKMEVKGVIPMTLSSGSDVVSKTKTSSRLEVYK